MMQAGRTSGASLRSRLSLAACRKVAAVAEQAPAAAAAHKPLADITDRSLGNNAPEQPSPKAMRAVAASPAAAAAVPRAQAEPAPALQQQSFGGEDEEADDDLPCFDILGDAIDIGAAAEQAAPVPSNQGPGPSSAAAGQWGLAEPGCYCRGQEEQHDSPHDAVAEPWGNAQADAGPFRGAAEAWGHTTAEADPAGGAAEPGGGPDPAAAAAYDTPQGFKRPLGHAAAAGLSLQGASEAQLATSSGTGATGRRARLSSRRKQMKYTPLFGGDGLEAAMMPAEQLDGRAAAAGLAGPASQDDSDLFDVPWLSSKKEQQQQQSMQQPAQQQQQQQEVAAGTQPRPSTVRRLPSSLLRSAGGSQDGQRQPAAGGSTNAPAHQLARAGLTLSAAAVPVCSVPSTSQKLQGSARGLGHGGCTVLVSREDGNTAAVAGAADAGGAAGTRDVAVRLPLEPVPDSEDDEEAGWGGSKRCHEKEKGGKDEEAAPPASAPSPVLRRLHKAGSLHAAAAAAAAGQSPLGSAQRPAHQKPGQRQLSPSGPTAGTVQQAERVQQDAEAACPMQAKPWASLRPALSLAPTEAAAAAGGSKPKPNPFARAGIKATRVVLASHDEPRPGSSSAAARHVDTAGMMQSVLNSLPPPPSPPKAVAAPSDYDYQQEEQQDWESGGGYEWEQQQQQQQQKYHHQERQENYQQQQRRQQQHQEQWQQAQRASGIQEEPAWHESGGWQQQEQHFKARQQEQRQRQPEAEQQQQREPKAEQGQMLTWEEHSRQHRLQEQSGSFWHQPAWFQQLPGKSVRVPEAQQQQQQQQAQQAQQAQQEPSCGQGGEAGPSREDSEDDFAQPGPSHQQQFVPPARQQQQHWQQAGFRGGGQAPQQQQQQRKQLGWQGDVINLVNSPPTSPGRNAPGHVQGFQAGSSNIEGQPWWYRLPDLVPVEILSKGKNPRDGSVVYIDYQRQFTGAAGGGVTAAARQAGRQQQQAAAGGGAGGFLAAGAVGGGGGRGPAAKSRRRQGQAVAAGSEQAVGRWVGKSYINASGRTLYGQYAYLEYCKEAGKDPAAKKRSKGGSGGKRKRKGSGGGGKRVRKG